MALIQKKYIASNAVDETKIRLSNDAYLKARNAADSGDVDILKIDTNNKILAGGDFYPDGNETRNLGTNGGHRWNSIEVKTVVNNGGPLELNGINVDFLGNELLNVAAPSVGSSGTNKTYVDNLEALDIRKDGSRAFTANQSMGGFNLTNVADPTAAQHAATKIYVDNLAQGLKPKQAVRAASTANVAIATGLENGDTLDGVTLATGDRVLLKDQTLPEENGIYVVVASGAASRSTDFDSLSPIDEINGAYTFAQEGSSNAGKAFVQSGTVAILDTDSINFVFFNSAGTLVGHDMIVISGNNVSVDLATVSGLESSNPGNVAGQLRVKLESSNPSLKIDGSNQLAAKLDAAGAIASGASGLAVQVDASTIEISSNALRVKDAGITLAKMASLSVDENKLTSSVAGNGLSGGAGTALSVNVDDSTIEINADTLRVKDNGIVGAKVLMARYSITLSGTDITNQYVDITATHKLKIESVVLQPRDGIVQEYARDYDLDNSGSESRIRFDSTNLPNSDLATGGSAALIAGDVLLVQGIRNV
jgi:hypothetical protein